jgi:hypothetical protein
MRQSLSRRYGLRYGMTAQLYDQKDGDFTNQPNGDRLVKLREHPDLLMFKQRPLISPSPEKKRMGISRSYRGTRCWWLVHIRSFIYRQAQKMPDT